MRASVTDTQLQVEGEDRGGLETAQVVLVLESHTYIQDGCWEVNNIWGRSTDALCPTESW